MCECGPNTNQAQFSMQAEKCVQSLCSNKLLLSGPEFSTVNVSDIKFKQLKILQALKYKYHVALCNQTFSPSEMKLQSGLSA